MMTTSADPQRYYNPIQRPSHTGPPCRVRPNLSLATNPKIEGPCHSNPGNSLTGHPSKALILVNPTHLLVTTIPPSHSVSRLCPSVSTTPMHNSVLGCHLHQTSSRKPLQRANQLLTVHARRLAQPITTHRASLAALPKAHRTKLTNQIYPITATKKPTKKGYINLTRTRQNINPKASIPDLTRMTKMSPTLTKISKKQQLISLETKLCATSAAQHSL